MTGWAWVGLCHQRTTRFGKNSQFSVIFSFDATQSVRQYQMQHKNIYRKHILQNAILCLALLSVRKHCLPFDSISRANWRRPIICSRRIVSAGQGFNKELSSSSYYYSAPFLPLSKL